MCNCAYVDLYFLELLDFCTYAVSHERGGIDTTCGVKTAFA